MVPPQLWLALYVDATLFQMWVYIRNRRYNVSPFETEGSPGLRGMFMSVLTSPIYAAGMIATILRRPAKFVVTPKAVASSTDSLWTFWRHLMWAGLLGVAVVAAFVQGYANVDVLMWPVLAMLIALTPIALCWLDKPTETEKAQVQARRADPIEWTPEIGAERTELMRAVA